MLKARQRRRCHPQLAQGDMQTAELRRKVARHYALQRCLQKRINAHENTQQWRFESTARDLIKKLWPDRHLLS